MEDRRRLLEDRKENLTTAEAAYRAGFSLKMFIRAVRDGEVTPLYPERDPRKLMFSRLAIDKWIERGGPGAYWDDWINAA